MKNSSFGQWLLTFLDEKGIDLEYVLNVPGPSGDNHMPVACLVDAILQASPSEQIDIKCMIVRIDYCNGDVVKYLCHLARAIAI